MDPVGEPVLNGAGPARAPVRVTLKGRFVTLLPLKAEHSAALFTAIAGPGNDALWTYIPVGPFHDATEFSDLIAARAQSDSPLFFAVHDNQRGQLMGIGSLRSIDTQHRATEHGFVIYSSQMQRSPATTEAAYLLARYVFEELGYRRYVWRANDLNEPSKRAALRLGFTYEGLLRQDWIIKGRNRDTALFSMLDSEWVRVKRGFERWLDPGNFTAEGVQIQKLEMLREGL